MVELYSDLSDERKSKIRQQIDFYFSMFENSSKLPDLLNNYMNTFSDELEQDFADFYINLKFVLIQKTNSTEVLIEQLVNNQEKSNEE